MKISVKEFKKEYKKINIDNIEVSHYYKNDYYNYLVHQLLIRNNCYSINKQN